MIETQIQITDARMLEVIDILIENGTIRYQKDFCDQINILKQALRQIRIGKQHFTAAQIAAACSIFNVNANWIVGIEPNVFRTKKLTKGLTKGK